VWAGFVERSALDGPYDVVIFSNCCYSFVQGSSVRIGMLTHVAAQLNDGGRLAISYSPRHGGSRWAATLARIGARLGRSDWQPEEGDTFARSYLSSDVLKYEHLFLPGEVERECDAAGLRVICNEAVPGSVPWLVAVSR
jgi:hypothetical protein